MFRYGIYIYIWKCFDNSLSQFHSFTCLPNIYIFRDTWVEWALFYWWGCKETVSDEWAERKGRYQLLVLQIAGTCLFNSISTLLGEIESTYEMLRMKTVRKFITSRYLYGELLEYLKCATEKKNESFEEEILDTIKNSNYANIMHLKAFVTLTNRHMNSTVENVLADRRFFHRYITPPTNEEWSSTEK